MRIGAFPRARLPAHGFVSLLALVLFSACGPGTVAGDDVRRSDAFIDSVADARSDILAADATSDAGTDAPAPDAVVLPLNTWNEVSRPPADAVYGGRPGLAVGQCVIALNYESARVQSARERAPGDLGPWHESTPLPNAATYDTWVAGAGEWAFVGPLSPGCFSCYFVARIDPATCDPVSGWTRSGPAAAPSGTRSGVWMTATTMSIGGRPFVYAMGGYFAGVKNDALFAPINTATGELTPWDAILDLGGPAMSGSAVAVGTSLFLIGGGTDTDPYIGATTDAVRVAMPDSNGAAASFTDAGRLPWSARGIVVAATARYVYAIGGVGPGASDHVRRAARARITGSSLGAWEDVPSLVSSLPSGYFVGFLPRAQIGNTVYAIAGGDTRPAAPPEPRAFSAILE